MVKGDYYKKHQNLLKSCFLKAQSIFPDIRLFERHVGMFKTFDGQNIRINRPGMADAWFIHPSPWGLLHGEIEFKAGKSGLTKDQKNWRDFIENLGGIYILARNEDDFINELKGALLPVVPLTT